MTGDAVVDFTVRRVTTQDGRELTVRPVGVEDAPALAALYAGLDRKDRYLRFFSAYHPPEEFFQRMTTVAEGGGFGLVALNASVGTPEEVVAQAGYTLIPNGDGELAITVAEHWRGGLGSYLLDTLLAAAAERGVPNLEAEVMIANGPMLALARARDCVLMERPDWTLIRVLIGTNPTSPTWPGHHDRTRVLVEGRGDAWHQKAAREAGLEVLVCPGPATRRRSCPALGGTPCPLAAGADVIVVRSASSGEEEAAPNLVAAHGRLHRGVPVCLEVLGGTNVSSEGGVSDASNDVPLVTGDGEQPVVELVRRLATEREGTARATTGRRARGTHP